MAEDGSGDSPIEETGTNLLDTITGLPIPLSVRKGLLKAVGKLATGVVGVATAKFEVMAESIHTEGRARDLVTMAAAQAAAEQVPNDPEIVKRALRRFGGKLVTQQRNVERIAELTVEEIKAAEPIADPPELISDRWLDHYSELAERQSNEEMQLYFAKILAGEIIRPGRFDPTSLTILNQMTQALAKDFQKLCSMSVLVEDEAYVIIFVASLKGPTTTPNSLSEEGIKGEQLRAFGLDLAALLRLRAAGLLASLPEEQFLEFTNVFDGRSLPYAGAILSLDADRHKKAHGKASWCNALSLTSAGNEIRSILSLTPDECYTAALSAMMERGGIDMKLGR